MVPPKRLRPASGPPTRAPRRRVHPSVRHNPSRQEKLRVRAHYRRNETAAAPLCPEGSESANEAIQGRGPRYPLNVGARHQSVTTNVRSGRTVPRDHHSTNGPLFALRSRRSAFGHCWIPCRERRSPPSGPKPPSIVNSRAFLVEVSPTDWVVTLRGLGRAPRGLPLAFRADREPPSQRQARP
jgi:hypothetical protein